MPGRGWGETACDAPYPGILTAPIAGSSLTPESSKSVPEPDLRAKDCHLLCKTAEIKSDLPECDAVQTAIKMQAAGSFKNFCY